MSEDLRIQKSKQAIKNAFLSLLAEKGFEKITIKDICTQVMIGKSTFYYHYEDKYDLARQLAIQSLKNYQQHVLIPR
ncbi:TetR/AcrR family transcriptional regulator [Lactobacillus sp. MRS-253-APC-2B]|uniref:TetR family transcriptional regulator n=1 Tax=Lactobacillus sp. MRS-253-APC-2B TaxID=2725305 RepID=UPI00146A05FA|nr:TetR/AcrR family transcriptional regulator [Lactobacillus sp. MRS-253-APC-2B]